jgi:hypothetical protein
MAPNVLVECLTFQLRIREVPRLILAPKTGYLDLGLLWSSSVPPGECRDSTLKLGHDRFLPNPFPIHPLLIAILFEVIYQGWPQHSCRVTGAARARYLET